MKLELQEDAFVNELAKEIAVPGIKPVDAIERLLSQHLTTCLKSYFSGRLIKPPSTRIHPSYNDNFRHRTLSCLAQEGYQTWYPELRFATLPSDALDEIALEPIGITVGEISYGFGIRRSYSLKIKELKKQTNHIITLNILGIEKHLFQRTLLSLQGQPLEQPYIANPMPWQKSSSFEPWLERNTCVSFDHLLDGSRLFCACSQAAHESMLAAARIEAPRFVENSWPHKVINLLSHAKYAESICHLCIAETYGAETAALRYRDTMQEFLGVYTNQLMLCNNLDKRTAKAEVEEKLNLSRWINETEMYSLIKQLFPDKLVLREASPPWLGRQRLDVFLPQLQLAFEYQGAQHYEAVEIFGGIEALKRTIERDELKKRLCEENRIELVCIKFSEPLALASLRHRLRRFMGS